MPRQLLAALLATTATTAAVLCAAPGLAGAATGSTPSSVTATSTTQAPASVGSSGWTVYHGDPEGSGLAASITGVDTSRRAWTSPVLDGQLYGEPLVFGGRIYVATESDTVDALSAATGAVLWSRTIGTPVPAGDLPCGDIAPTVGITGTPVVDPGRDELFAVADELRNGAVAHVLVGLSATDGRVETTTDVDPTGSDPRALLQRTGLTLDGGRVAFGFGGNYGDCSTYHGWVVSVPETGGTPGFFEVDAAAGEHEGAIWMGGAAPVVDPAGNIWATSGNGSVTSPDHAYDRSDAVLELSPSLALLQFFAPTSWTADNAKDLDLSTAPVLLPGGQVLAAGKSRTVYLLNGSRLGGVGGELARLPGACGDDIDGGAARLGSTVFLPCLSGLAAVTTAGTPPKLRSAWTTPSGGGPPIVAGGLVWSIGQDGTLTGVDPSTGAARQQASIGAPSNHFPTPGIGAGLLLATAARQVVAFHTTTGAAPATTTTRPAHRPAASAPPGRSSDSDPGPGPVAGVIALVVLIGAAAIWAIRARLRR